MTMNMPLTHMASDRSFCPTTVRTHEYDLSSALDLKSKEYIDQYKRVFVIKTLIGEMAEWSKALCLGRLFGAAKTAVIRGVGSNPTLVKTIVAAVAIT